MLPSHFVCLTIALAFLSAFEIIRVNDLGSRLSQALNPSTTNFLTSSMTIRVQCCPTISEEFVMSNGRHFYVSDYSPVKGTILGTTYVCHSSGDVLVFRITSGQNSQGVGPSWAGTFAEVVPDTGSGSAFKGVVQLS